MLAYLNFLVGLCLAIIGKSVLDFCSGQAQPGAIGRTLGQTRHQGFGQYPDLISKGKCLFQNRKQVLKLVGFDLSAYLSGNPSDDRWVR